MDAKTQVRLQISARALQKLQECAEALQECGFGLEGPELETSFAEIEDFGHEAGRMLARLLEQQLAARHAEHFSQAAAACPGCQAQAAAKAAPLERSFQTRDGLVPLAEPAYHCPACQRDFFPSACSPED